jgi:hypothetical protein
MCVGLVQTHRAFAYNNAWANHRLLGACAELTQGEFEAERTGFFPRRAQPHRSGVHRCQTGRIDRPRRGSVQAREVRD